MPNSFEHIAHHRPARLTGSAAMLVATLVLAGCSSARYRPVADYPVRIGRPYAVRGTTYVPADLPAYDVVGYASWYGTESGDRTANGEKFRPRGISGAHTVLPLPSYVEVTALDTGRTILVRINDRGPFVQNRMAPRIIDLSRGAASLLGVQPRGTIPVHVRRADPSERDKALLRKGRPATPRSDVDPATLATLRTVLGR